MHHMRGKSFRLVKGFYVGRNRTPPFSGYRNPPDIGLLSRGFQNSMKEIIMVCPYSSGECCSLSGSHQEVYQRQTYCFSTDNCTRCANWRENGGKTCPYFTTGGCKGRGAGGSSQSAGSSQSTSNSHHRQTYCFSVSNCTRCANFG